MKTNSVSKTITHITDLYRFTLHLGSHVLEIEKWKFPEYSWQKGRWECIYKSHDDPLREAIKFYDENINIPQE